MQPQAALRSSEAPVNTMERPGVCQHLGGAPWGHTEEAPTLCVQGLRVALVQRTSDNPEASDAGSAIPEGHPRTQSGHRGTARQKWSALTPP